MKRFVLILSLLLAAVILLSACEIKEPQPAEPDETDPYYGLQFTSFGNGTCVLSQASFFKKTEFAVPSVSPDGERVIAIGEQAFRSCTQLTDITIPKSVTVIGNDAFRGCAELASITIAEDNPAFYSVQNCVIETG